MKFDMHIDSKIAELARILDTFAYDDEPAALAIAFLQEHSSQALEIICKSYCTFKFLSLDFFLQCSESEKTWLFDNIITKLPYNMVCYFLWQCCSKLSPLDIRRKQTINRKLSREQHTYTANASATSYVDVCVETEDLTTHPYSSRLSKLTESIDGLLMAYLSEGTMKFADMLSYMFNKSAQLCSTDVEIVYSIFAPRIFQLDVFEALPVSQQFFALKSLQSFLQTLAPTMVECRTKFIKQVLDGCSNDAVKTHVIELLIDPHFDTESKYCGLNWTFLPTNTSPTGPAHELRDKLESLDCFEELVLEQSLLFNEADKLDMSDVMLELLKLKKYSVLEDWISYDKQQFDSIMNMSSLVHDLCRKKLSRKRNKTKTV